VVFFYAGTYIDSWGFLYVDYDETAQTLTVRATSTFDITQSGTATVTVMDNTPPSEVTGLTATSGDRQVTLSWTDPADADLGHIEISWDGDNYLTVPKSSAENRANSTAITGLSNGAQYRFYLYTVDTWGNYSGTEIYGQTLPAPAGTVSVEFTSLPQDEDIVLSSQDGLSWAADTALTVTVSGSFAAYRWVLDGVEQSGTGASLTLNAGSLAVRQHSLTVFVTKVENGTAVEYTKRVTFTVAQ
jgi:hypothetical protein